MISYRLLVWCVRFAGFGFESLWLGLIRVDSAKVCSETIKVGSTPVGVGFSSFGSHSRVQQLDAARRVWMARWCLRAPCRFWWLPWQKEGQAALDGKNGAVLGY